jgi:hypothetical protein
MENEIIKVLDTYAVGKKCMLLKYNLAALIDFQSF